MKKFIAVLLLNVYLFSATDIKELLKIEVVIDHLHEHQMSDSSITLYQFLVMHYVTNDRNDNDNIQDSQLPFISPDSIISNVSFASIVNPFSSLKFHLGRILGVLLLPLK